MSRLSPPLPPPTVTVSDDDRLERMQLRCFQIVVSAITLAFTGWFCTMGAIPAILTVFVTKHILVAVYAVGLHHPLNQPKT